MIGDWDSDGPWLMPRGWQSTGEPWVPGRNNAVCSGREVWPWPHGWTGLAPPPLRDAPPHLGDQPRARHPAPAPDCKCGLYAMHSIRQELQRAGRVAEEEVLGAVVGWGAIEVHANGWRAQYAMVTALWSMAELGAGLPLYPTHSMCKARRQITHDVRLLAKRYGVRAVDLEELQSVAESYGQPLPEAGKREVNEWYEWS